MSVNWYKPHIILVPEDEAIHRIAVEFRKAMIFQDVRWHVDEYKGGWIKVVESLAGEVQVQLSKPHRIMIALIDFDGHPEARRNYFFSELPESVHDRIFLFGLRGQAEDLKRSMGLSLSEIGITINRACLEGDLSPWDNEQLAVNKSELERLNRFLKERNFQIGNPNPS
jgi:hypothetical protein